MPARNNINIIQSGWMLSVITLIQVEDTIMIALKENATCFQ